MDDINELLKRLAEAKLKSERPEIIEVDKPVFKKSEPGTNIKYRLKQQPETPQDPPIDYAALNNPSIQKLKEIPQERIPTSEPKKDSGYASLQKAMGSLSVDVPKEQQNESEQPPTPEAKMNSDRYVGGLVQSLQQIPDEELDSKEATLQEMLEDPEMTEYEKAQLLEWAKQDADRIRMINQK